MAISIGALVGQGSFAGNSITIPLTSNVGIGSPTAAKYIIAIVTFKGVVAGSDVGGFSSTTYTLNITDDYSGALNNPYYGLGNVNVGLFKWSQRDPTANVGLLGPVGYLIRQPLAVGNTITISLPTSPLTRMDVKLYSATGISAVSPNANFYLYDPATSLPYGTAGPASQRYLTSASPSTHSGDSFYSWDIFKFRACLHTPSGDAVHYTPPPGPANESGRIDLDTACVSWIWTQPSADVPQYSNQTFAAAGVQTQFMFFSAPNPGPGWPYSFSAGSSGIQMTMSFRARDGSSGSSFAKGIHFGSRVKFRSNS